MEFFLLIPVLSGALSFLLYLRYQDQELAEPQ